MVSSPRARSLCPLAEERLLSSRYMHIGSFQRNQGSKHTLHWPLLTCQPMCNTQRANPRCRKQVRDGKHTAGLEALMLWWSAQAPHPVPGQHFLARVLPILAPAPPSGKPCPVPCARLSSVPGAFVHTHSCWFVATEDTFSPRGCTLESAGP